MRLMTRKFFLIISKSINISNNIFEQKAQIMVVINMYKNHTVMVLFKKMDLQMFFFRKIHKLT